jgi:leucyl aminopeptidase
VLGVGQGSNAPSRFIILEYFCGKKSERPIVLIGKGVTFDTGGINLKPSDYILGMNMDMSGGAAVIHALAAAARLKVKKNIVVLVPAVENMMSGASYRPGDIIRSMSGKTIEVLNTDAEGRIILADALHYAKRYRPALVIDVATLTGAAMGALGERASALFTEDEALELRLRHLGEESGDYVWPLPLWEEYDDEVKGTFGDVANLGRTRYGGAITAAVFLKQFVDKAYPWVHLDIAPRMTTLPDEFLSKGSAGAPVRLLIKVVEREGF